jgi:phosphoribosylanthranilate isomerase
MPTAIKICGLTRRSDAAQAASLGVDLLGFIFAPSPRKADPKELRAWLPEMKREYPRVRMVGVFLRPQVDEVEEVAAALCLDLVQVHGWEERPGVALSVDWILAAGAEFAPAVLRRFGSGEQDPTSDGQGGRRIPWAILVDNSAPDGAGGSGCPFDWSALEATDRAPGVRLFLAGGLEADNVAEAIARIRPYGVDASSRLEVAPGVKDPARVIAFVKAVRQADEADTAAELKPLRPVDPTARSAEESATSPENAGEEGGNS